MSKLSEAVRSDDHVAGNPDGKVTLVGYGDYQCPYCGAAHPIVKQILKRIGGDIRFVFRNFPLSEIHPHAVHAAAAAESAVAEGKFWEMHDTIFEHQKALEDRDLASYGDAVGIDRNHVLNSLTDEAILERIQHDFMTGVRSGVNGTPTFFIDGVRHDESWDFKPLLEALEAALAR